ncbi:MAG: HD domain-containing protein [Mariniphaga sp.]
MHNLKEYITHPVFGQIGKISDQEGVETYVVGGFVRDLLLDRKREHYDIDVVTVGSGIELATKVAAALRPGLKVTVFKNFGTAMFRYDEIDFEFVGARRESYQRESRKPFVEDGTLADDQKRRDFTINALALCLNSDRFGELLDSFDGVGDLDRKIIRTPLEPEVTFSDDPLRMLRAIRFAAQLDFMIEDKTLEAIQTQSSRIEIVSRERVTDELNKIILSPKPSIGFKLLEKTGLLAIILPEIQKLKGRETKNGIGHKDNFYHTLEVLDRISKNTDNLWLRWSALLHDVAKPVTKRFDLRLGWTFHAHNFVGEKMLPSIFDRLKLPLNEKLKYVQKLVSLHMRPIVLSEEEVTDSAVRRLLCDAGDDIDDLMTLCEADITSKNPDKVSRFMSNFQLVREKLKDIEERDALRNFQPPITGEIIMETFSLPPGREIGIIKSAIKEAILEGEIHNNYDEAYRYMLAKGAELGLKAII